ncbi:MAG: low temperature requirement protein A [Solirubrobacterales bacterium]
MEATKISEQGEDAERPDGAGQLEQRVTPLELFFDLVLVFAFTQVTALMSDNPTWEGVGQGCSC